MPKKRRRAGAHEPPAPVSASSPGPTDARTSRLEALLASPSTLYVALALAALLRVTHLLFLSQSPLADWLALDHAAYDAWGQRIAAGTSSTAPFWVDPLYAYALALVYTLFGHHLGLVRVMQAALGVVTVGLTGSVTRRATGSAALGNAAALVAALYVPFVHDEAQIEKCTIATCLSLAALLFYLRASPRDLVISGVLAGLAALTRGALLLFLPVAFLHLLLERPDATSAARAPRAEARRIHPDSFRRALRFLVPAALVVSLATLHNLRAGDDLVLTTTNGGANLYIGQFRGNPDGVYAPPPFVRPDPAYEEADFRAEAERRVGHAVSPSDASTFWRSRAFEEMGADPGAAGVRSLKKLWLAVHDFEVPDDDDIDAAGDWSPIPKLPVFWLGQLVPFALLGAVVTWRRSRELRIVAVAAAVHLAPLVAFFVVGRFRGPLVPPVITLACVGVAWLVEKWRAGARRELYVAGGAVLVGLVLCVWTPPFMARIRTSGLAVTYNDLGAQRLAAGDESGAIDAYRRAVAIAPESVIAAQRQLGELYLQRREYAEAERAMRDVLARKPDSGRAKDALVRLYEAMVQDPARAGDTSLRAKLASAYRAAGRDDDADRLASGGVLFVDAARARQLYAAARQARLDGRWDDAITAMKGAIDVGPYDEDAHYSLGELMAQHATPAAMIEYFRRTRARDPKPQTSLYYWAVGLERSGDTQGAIARLREALDVDPAHEMSELRWCQILEHQGANDDALSHCDRAVEIFPEFAAAHTERATILDALGRTAEASEARDAAARSHPNTPKRYFYWARTLARAGRWDAAASELGRALQADPNDADARALLAEVRTHVPSALAGAAGGAARGAGGTGPGTRDAPARPSGAEGAPTLSPDALGAIADALRAAPPGSPCWITATRADVRAHARAEELASAFADAGWNVHALAATDVRVRPGVFLFAADETPPSYVSTIDRALRAGGITATVGNSYRSYYAERLAADPSYQGFPLADDQSFVLVVGRIE